MRLGYPAAPFIDFHAQHERYEGGRAGDDVWVTITVVVDTFGTVTGGGFVARSDWGRFLEHLTALEASRRGEAVLASAHPQEFSLRIHASDSLGHMAVEGILRWPEAFERAEFRFAGIGFEPTVLPGLLLELREAAA
jgi:hypothetical protein